LSTIYPPSLHDALPISPRGAPAYCQYQTEVLCIPPCTASHNLYHRRNPDTRPEKNNETFFSPVSPQRSLSGTYSAESRTFLYAGRMILSVLISSSILWALQPTIRATANIGV